MTENTGIGSGPAFQTAGDGVVQTGTDPRAEQFAQSGSSEWAQSDADDFGPDEGDNDPLEVPNRMFFAFNEALDFAVIRPIAVTYRFIVPTGVRNSVRNFLRNLRSPVVFANDLLQGELERAETTAARFFINSTIGLLGLFDIAADSGYPYHSEDFGQTLGTYGSGEGIYLVLPIFGPSSLRDAGGLVVDTLMDPLTYIAPDGVGIARGVATGVDLRSRTIDELDELKRDSLDFYARIRSLYRQNRESEINNGAPPADSPDFSEVPAPGETDPLDAAQSSSAVE
ncbi:VacJ family lipoprotein [Pelagibius litoralis]|uniref:VacJ family lipoprotein n=1 Tax=Pelagibius litoralis TaxID=374515 RepID=A0A967EWW2_9PROT|nr:VacJ family lipoprotein [Pelagibius litoralis]NIA68673.1 VacJ family lipoprotein [Pelagibius litoralis]